MSGTPGARLRAVPFALLPIVQWAVSFRLASTIRTVGTYDTAHYYVIARNFALGRGLSDTVLWHFLGAPDTVAQPAGGYWEIGWPILLGSLLRVFGHTQRAAIFVCAALSGLLPLLAALVAWLATRRALVAWLAGALLIAQARLCISNITPDVILFYQLSTLGALAAAALARDRGRGPFALLAAGAALALPAYVRGEGFVVALIALPALFLSWDRADRLRRLAHVIAGAALLVFPFTLRNLAVFGHLSPPGRSLRIWMSGYSDLFRFTDDPSAAAFWAQGRARLLGIRWSAIVLHLDEITRQIPYPLLAFAAAGIWALHRRDRASALTLPLLVVASFLVPCLAVPVVASADRFVLAVTPILAILAAAGIVAIQDGARRALDHPATSLLVLAVAFSWSALRFREGRRAGMYIDVLRVFRDTPPALTATSTLGLRRDDVVLTDDPWRVAAVLDVAAVMCPIDGPAAVDALFDKYHPRFVLVGQSPALRRLAGESRSHLRAVGRPKSGWYEVEGPSRSAAGERR